MALQRPVVLSAGQFQRLQPGSLLDYGFPTWNLNPGNGPGYWAEFANALSALAAMNQALMPLTPTITSIGSSPNGCFGAVLAPNGFIYGIPKAGNPVPRINTANNALDTVSGGTITNSYYGGVLATTGVVYGIPHGYATVLKITPSSGGSTDSWTEESISTTVNCSGGSIANDGAIYCPPYSGTTGYKIDPLNSDTLTSFSTSVVAGEPFYGAALCPTGNVIVPGGSLPEQALSITPGASPSAAKIGSGTSTWSIGGAAISPDGLIYAATAYDESLPGILVSGNAASIVTQSVNTAPDSTSGAVLGPDGMIYLLPSGSSYTSLLRFNQIAGTFTSIGTFADAVMHRCGVVATNGYMYCFPSAAGTIYAVGPLGQAPLNFCLSRYVNKY